MSKTPAEAERQRVVEYLDAGGDATLLHRDTNTRCRSEEKQRQHNDLRHDVRRYHRSGGAK